MTSSTRPPSRDVAASSTGSSSNRTDPEQHEQDASTARDSGLGVRTLWQTLIAGIGVSFIGLAAILVFAPRVIESHVPITTIAQSPAFSDGAVRSGALLVFGVVCAVWIAWTRPSSTGSHTETATKPSESSPEFAALRSNPPEEADGPVVGAAFDAGIARTTEKFDAGIARTTENSVVRRDGDVRYQLRSLAVEGLVTVDGQSRDEAESRVDDGAWTDDPVAAAYLADQEATLPFWRRLRAWLRPAQTQKDRIVRTIEALATRFGEHTGDRQHREDSQ